MRFFVKAALIGSLALAVQGGSASARADDRDDDDDVCAPAHVVVDMLDAFSTGDAGTVTSFLDDNVVFTNTGMPTFMGASSVETLFSEFLPLFSHIQFEEQSVMSRGHEVLVRRVEHFTVSPNAPIGNPGVSYDNPVMGHYVVEHCRITQWNDYWDPQDFIRATGLPVPLK
jgi:limonene-1,2-epoxide hydrolase